MDYTVHGILQARRIEWVAFAFSRGIFPTQGSNPGLPRCRQILYQLSHKGSPKKLEWVTYPFSSGFSQPRNPTRVSCIAVDSLPTELSGKPKTCLDINKFQLLIKHILCVFNWVWMKEKLRLQVWICKYLGSHCFVLEAWMWVCGGPNKDMNGKVKVSSVTSKSVQVFILKKTSCFSVSQWLQSSLSESYLVLHTAASDFYPRNFQLLLLENFLLISFTSLSVRSKPCPASYMAQE